MLSTPEGFTDNSPMLTGPSVTVKIPVQENHSVNLLNCCMSKIKLPSASYVLINQIARHSYQAVCCGLVFQICEYIQKLMNELGKIFIIVFYSILKLCGLQFPMIFLKYLLEITLNYRYFQNSFCNFMSGNFIIAW